MIFENHLKMDLLYDIQFHHTRNFQLFDYQENIWNSILRAFLGTELDYANACIV